MRRETKKVSDKELLYLDSGVVINLYATGQMAALLQALPYRCLIMDELQSRRLLLWAENTEEEQTQQEREAVDLSPLIEQGLLEVTACDVFANSEFFVAFAVSLPDSQAKMLTLAQAERAAIATDDICIQQIVQRIAPEITIYTTPTLLHQWETQRQKTNDEMRVLAQRIAHHALFFPEKEAPLYKWWMELIQS